MGNTTRERELAVVAFNPQRLDIARQRRGLTKASLATALSVSTRMLSAYEAHTSLPSDATIDRMSERLDFPRSFFFGDDLDEPSVDGTSFRAMSRLTSRQRDQARGAAAIASALTDWVDARFKLPEQQVPTYEGIDAETAAIAVRSEWGVGERPIKNMIHTLEGHGVRVFSLPEECSAVDAFSFWHGKTPVVFLNTVKSSEHRRMDAAHELGHLVLHHKGSVHGLDAEHQAAAFASAFLMPRGSVLAEAPRAATLPALIAAKSKWGVSVAALTFRMHALDLLNQYQYRSLFVEMGIRGYRRDEPSPMRPETSRLLAEIVREVRKRGTSLPDLARELHLHLHELAMLFFRLVPVTLTASAGQMGTPPRGTLRAVR